MKQNLNVDYRVRSVARIDNNESGYSFKVLCYGMPHSDLCTVGEDAGGQRLQRRLEYRGIDTTKWRGNLFNTAAVTETYGRNK